MPGDPEFTLSARGDASAAQARDLERRLLEADGVAILLVELASGPRLAGPMLATLLRARRRLEMRQERLLVSAADPELRHELHCAGLDLLERNGSSEEEPSGGAPPRGGLRALLAWR